MRRTKRTWIIMSVLALLVTGLGMQSCIDRISTSKGLRCDASADCWDSLSCDKGFCGGEGRPPKEGDEDEKTKDAGTDKGTADKGNADKGVPEQPTQEQQTPDTLGVDQGTDAGAGEKAADQTGGQCKGNLDAFGACKQDSDCCQGQTCKEQATPVGKVKLCGGCQSDNDCPQSTVCCFNTVCAPRCSQ